MEEIVQFLPQVMPQVMRGKVDTSQQVFGVVDDISQSFQEELEVAQSNLPDQGPDLDLDPNPEKVADSQQESPVPEEQQIKDPPSEEQEAKPSPDAVVSPPQPEESEEIEVEVENTLEPEPEMSTEEAEILIPEEEVEKEIEVEVEQSIEEQPEPEVAVEEHLPLPQSQEPLLSEKVEAIPPVEVQKQEMIQETPQVKEENTPVLVQPKPKPELQTPPQAPPPEPLRKTEESRSISVSAEIEVTAEESEKITQELSEVAKQTQVKPPFPQKVSAQLLEGLKATHSEMAKDIESKTGKIKPEHPLDTNAKTSSSTVQPFAPLQQIKLADKPYPNPRLEHLKQKVVDQVRFQMRTAMRGKIGEIKLTLNPRILGQIKVKIALEHSQMSAHFIVENQSVKDLLLRSSSQLQEMLAEHQIDINDVEVSVADEYGENPGDGKAFASAEEQEAARQYIASFTNFSDDNEEQANNEADPEAAQEPEEEESILNIMA